MVVAIAWTIITSSSKLYSQVCLCVTTYWVKFYVPVDLYNNMPVQVCQLTQIILLFAFAWVIFQTRESPTGGEAQELIQVTEEDDEDDQEEDHSSQEGEGLRRHWKV